MHLVFVVFNQLTRQAVLLIDDAAHFRVHLLHGLLAHVGGFGHRAAQEHFALIFCVHHRAQRVSHTVARHHVTGNMGSSLKVVAGTSGHLVHEDLFSNTATKQHANLVQHVLAVIAVTVLCGQAHGHTQRTTTRNDGDFVHRVALGQQLANQGMPRLVVSRVLTLSLRHDHALALRAHQNLVLGLFKVLHFNGSGIATCGHQGCFVAQVSQIST